MPKRLHGARPLLAWRSLLLGAGLFTAIPAAHAFQLYGSPDWEVRLDNTLSYNLGVRAQDINDKIGNNPNFQQSDYKFDKAGDLVTNRVADLLEFDAVYKERYGFRFSGSAWKDFAYDDEVKYNPGNLTPLFPEGALGPGSPEVPATPYSALSTYSSGKYDSYTKRFFVEGAQVLDAFVFANFQAGGTSTSIKLGRVTQYWGNSLIFGSMGISYAQNATDYIKAFTAPGTQLKELAIPRAQFYLQSQFTPTMSIALQYFGEWMPSRLPEGGTYLGTYDLAFQGPDQQPGLGPHGKDVEPDNVNDNYGVKYTWRSEAFRGTFGFYYRQLDETIPWILIALDPNTFAPSYHLSYAQKVKLFGISLDKQIGAYSTGFEVSYRKNTALSTALAPNMNDLAGEEGARGDTLNVIANVLAGLTPTPLYQTGTVLAEVTYTRKMKLRGNEDAYNGVNHACAALPRKEAEQDGCATTGAWGIAGQFDPQWLQVFPGVDIDTPIFAQYGIAGNAANNFAFLNEGFIVYTAGIHALIRQRYNVTLQYNGYHAKTNGVTNAGLDAGMPVPVGTPGFPTYYRTTSMPFFWNDRGWVSLSFSYTF